MHARATDWSYCQTYANQFAVLFKDTVDRDINPYYRDRAFSEPG